METAKPVRVVPSGKVYRQIFDAEVQLVQALEASKSGKKDGSAAQKGSRIPLVHSAGEGPDTGLLTQRQRTWVDGYPNEYDIENPVIYRHTAVATQEQEAEPESSKASKEVQGLPDILSPTKKGSDIIERIAESRKERHEYTLEEMHQELGVISSDVEPKIEKAGQQLIIGLSENDKTIDSIMAKIDTDEKLLKYSLEELAELWEEVAQQSISRQDWITQLDEKLAGIEENRMEKVREVFSRYAEALEKIAHLMAPDLQRLLDKESQMINQTVLSNRRAYADLFARLMMADIEREKKLHTQWKKRAEDWKQLNTQLAVDGFRDYMESEVVTDPETVRNVLEQMQAEQTVLNNQRIELLQSLQKFKPPASTKTAVYEWNKRVSELSKQIDALNQQFFNKLYAEYEHVLQECLSVLEQMKHHLTAIGACSQQQAEKVATEQCVPLVGERQTIFEKNLEEMDKALEEHNAHMEQQLRALFKFIQGAAHVWDVHEIGLAKQERALQEKLSDCRRQHDGQNQDLEANLDIMMDRMRQEATEQALKDSLKKVLDMLTKIKAGYEVFHKDQLDIVDGYPDMVDGELRVYDSSVCKFFGVDRIHPDEAQKRQEEEDQASARSGTKKKVKARRPGSRPSSQASDLSARSKTESPVPLVVSETLYTEKGTTFYVLTVAKETTQEEDDTETGSQTFLTETAPQGDQAKPAYIASVDVEVSFMSDIRRQVRLNFLNHLENWQDQAIDRSHSVVAAKKEELNSELDLRLHLHQPRARRSELDVHNVRAAELVMHAERVTRHCKGINQALNELRHKFNSMTLEHNDLTDKFRSDIEAMEVIFINATKSSKLVSLSNQLQTELDKYMGIIRASLRQFRQHLDETLQMLRDSNARFIKSFKVFSDGGNFCPEEIDEYRKRLEKMSQKTDSAEGFIMADLEGMESKRLDQATKIANEFEDRFKNHMVDLLFMEKIARWLTNTQVKIKAEVADSNSQAQQLAQMLNDLERRIDACERPNPDKETVSPGQLNDSLKVLFETTHKRSLYLDCLKETHRPVSAAMQGSISVGARVNFPPDAVPPISKPGKQPAEDPSVNMIRSILKTQKTKLRFGMDADLDGDPVIPERANTLHEVPSANREKSRTTLSRPATQQDNKSSKSSRRDTAATGSGTDGPKRTTSGTRRLSKGQKFDRTGLVFGEKKDENEDNYFLGKMKHILRDALDGLIAAAELYYRQKGTRQVTRPQALQETFEQCADVITQKLQSYYTQADQYHNQCLQEFRSQLWQLEHLVGQVPGCVIRELLQQQITAAQSERDQHDDEFSQQVGLWKAQQQDHKHLLRPTLGHPQQAVELQQLCEKEAERHELYLTGVGKHGKTLQGLAVDAGRVFIKELAKTAEQLLLQYDQALTVDDVAKGRVEPTKYPTSELIRRKNAGVPLEDDENKDALPRGQKTWPGIPSNQLVVGEASKEKITASVTTAKTTLGHTAVQTARDKAYKDYLRHFKKTLGSIDDQEQQLTDAEQRWSDSWYSSVEKVKKLYNTAATTQH